jgi:hypothetical protein
MCSVYDDVELLDWLRWAKGDGPSFLRTKAEATFTADLNEGMAETNPRDSMRERYRLSRRKLVVEEHFASVNQGHQI